MARLKKSGRRSFIPTTRFGQYSYIDTIVLRLPKRMTPQEYDDLYQSLGGATARVVRKVVHPKAGPWFCKLYIHQPTWRSMEVLMAMHSSFWLSEVHVALDIAVPTQADAYELRDFVVERIVKNMRPNQCVTWFQQKGQSRSVAATAYLAFDCREGSTVAIYADRATKTVTHAPCLHIEWRMRGVRELAACGLDSPLGIASLDHRKFWDDRLILLSPLSADRLQQLLLGRNTSSVVTGEQLMSEALSMSRGSPLVRVAANDLMYLINTKSHLVGGRTARWFREEGHVWMLPDTAENSLWG
jgi:hypothetical protein